MDFFHPKHVCIGAKKVSSRRNRPCSCWAEAQRVGRGRSWELPIVWITAEGWDALTIRRRRRRWSRCKSRARSFVSSDAPLLLPQCAASSIPRDVSSPTGAPLRLAGAQRWCDEALESWRRHPIRLSVVYHGMSSCSNPKPCAFGLFLKFCTRIATNFNFQVLFGKRPTLCIPPMIYMAGFPQLSTFPPPGA